MPRVSNRWTLVLAAGAGTRLSSLTSDGAGRSIPKQFCSLNGGPSLLEETIERAAAVAAPMQTIVIVAAEQRRFWQNALAAVPAENIVVQPVNRGTANGILLGVTAILERDPSAIVTALPSDHYIEREEVLRRSMLRALIALDADPGSEAINFLGIEPDLADPELGYIVRGEARADGTHRIAKFVEKPTREAANELLRRRALWNSFILVARASALVELVERRFPAEGAAFRSVWRQVGLSERLPEELHRLYARLPEIDFSRHVVEGANADLRVVRVPNCGWNDLGTPKRVAACLDRATPAPKLSSHFNLAEAYARFTGQLTASVRSA